MKYWERVADNLKKSGWSLGWVSALDLERRTIWIVDAHRDGKRFVVRADEKLTAFLELDLGQAIFAKQKTKKAQQENDRHVIKVTKEISMQHLILLAVVAMMVLYVLIIVGCLCYVGRHGRRAS